MKRTPQVVSFLLIVLLFAFSVSLGAQPNPRGGRHGGDMFKHKMHGFGIAQFADELGLTDDQQDKLKTLRVEGQKEAVTKRANIKIAQIELRELMQVDNPNEGAIKKQVEKVGRLKTDMMLTLVDKKLAVKKILTDEQEAKLKELRKERSKNFRRGGRGERNGRRGFGFNEEGFDSYFFGGIDEDDNLAPATGQEL